jgi:hypothetical protein
MLLDRRRLLMGWAVGVLGLGAAACESPTAPATGTRTGATEWLIAAAPATGMTLDTLTIAKLDTTRFKCVAGNDCPGVDTITVKLPGNDSLRLIELDSTSKQKVIVGTDTFVFQIGIWDRVPPNPGDFIGIIWKNGKFAGFWGHCSMEPADNWEYITRDPVTGKVEVHWFNRRRTDGKQYHYIYDPKTGKLKILYTPPGSTVETPIYDGPPIQHPRNIPPPIPAAGHGPWTGENQYDSTLPASTGSTRQLDNTAVELASAEGVAAAA